MSEHTHSMSTKPAVWPNLEAMGLIPAGSLGPEVAPDEVRRRLADYYSRHPLKSTKPGEPGTVDLVKQARADRNAGR